MSLAPNLLNTLQSIVAETQGAIGFSFANPDSPVIRALVKQEMIEVNKNTIDPSNSSKVACRATDKGVAEIAPPVQAVTYAPPAPVWTPPPTPTDMPAPAVTEATVRASRGPRGPRVVPEVIRSDVRFTVLPEMGKRGRGKGVGSETYPFSTLLAPDEAGFDSFFIANTDAMPNAFKTTKMAVFSANKRYKEKGIVFETRNMALDPITNLAGARVFRVA